MNDSELDPAHRRAFEKLVDRKIATLLESKTSAIDEQAAMARWLIASLLAINSGGLVYLANAKINTNFHYVAAATAFIAGILFAMLNAYLIQVIAMRMIAPLDDTISYWTIISDPSHEDADRLTELSKQYQQAQQYSWTAPVAGWLSALAFVVGVLLTGYSLMPQPTPSTIIEKKHG